MDLLSNFNQATRNLPSATSWLFSSDIRPSVGFVSARRLLLYGFFRSALHKSRLSFMVTTEAEALAALARCRPGLLIVTPKLEQGDGLALLAQAHQLVDDLRTIVICDQNHDDLLEAGQSEADGVVCEQDFLLEDQPIRAMIIALALRRRYRSPIVQAALSAAALLNDRGWRDEVPVMTSREQELVDLWVEGLGDREVADRLGVSYATVRSYGRTVRSKLGVANRAQVVLKVMKLGLSRAAVR